MLPPENGDSQESGHQPDQAGSAVPAADAQPAATPSADAQALDAQPADAQAPDTPPAAAASSPTPHGEATGRRSMRWPVTLGVATVLLGGFGIWATLAAHNLRSTNSGQNVALTDRAATSAVTHQISSAVNTIFSYSYADTAKTRRAAQGLLTGPAITQYNKLFALVQQQAPKEKLVVTTTVINSGVEYLTGGSARVLIFANQQDTRAGTSQTTYAGAMFAVTAVFQDGRWKIENIDTFTGGTG